MPQVETIVKTSGISILSRMLLVSDSSHRECDAFGPSLDMYLRCIRLPPTSLDSF